MINKPKEPLLALMLSSLYPGLGQIYSGYVRRGVLFAIFPLIMGLGFGWYLISPGTRLSRGFIWCAVIAGAFNIYIFIDSYLCARSYNKANKCRRIISIGRRMAYVFGIVLFLLVPGVNSLIGKYVRTNFVQAFKIPAGSMTPVLAAGDRLMVDKRIYTKIKPRRGDIIVFKLPQDRSREYLKRVIAFGGESVMIKGGDVYVDDTLVEDLVIMNIYYKNLGLFEDEHFMMRVPEGHVFVLGDNSLSSHDSRYWGTVPVEDIIGKAYKIYYPIGRSGPIP